MAVCETCGEPANFVHTFREVDTASGEWTGETHRYCKRCAKAAGTYPRFYQLIVAWIFYVPIWCLRPWLRRKYPPEYWQKRFRDLEAKRRVPPGTGV